MNRKRFWQIYSIAKLCLIKDIENFIWNIYREHCLLMKLFWFSGPGPPDSVQVEPGKNVSYPSIAIRWDPPNQPENISVDCPLTYFVHVFETAVTTRSISSIVKGFISFVERVLISFFRILHLLLRFYIALNIDSIGIWKVLRNFQQIGSLYRATYSIANREVGPGPGIRSFWSNMNYNPLK